jgi:hypothetical protein
MAYVAAESEQFDMAPMGGMNTVRKGVFVRERLEGI